MIQPSAEWDLDHRHIGRRVLVFDSVSSTNELALNMPEGVVVMAREQTKGRGQYGRSWHSGKDAGVWLSAIPSPPAHLRKPVILTAWAAVAVAETVRSIINSTPTIKWPNDVLVNEKKIAGVLIELGQRAITGIGLNVNQTTDQFTAASLPDATSLAILSRQPWDCDVVAKNLIYHLDREYGWIVDGNLQSLQDRWREYLGLLGQSVQVHLHSGSATNGTCLRLDFESVTIAQANGQILSFLPEQIRNISARVE